MARKVVTLGPSGVVFDETPSACAPDVYTNCTNFRVDGAGMQLAAGQQVLHASSGTFTPKFGMLVPVDAVNYSLIACKEGVVISNGATIVATLTPAGWSDFTAGAMTGAVLGGVPIFGSRGNVPWYWDTTLGASSVAPVPGWIAGKQARVFGAFGQHMFAGGFYGALTEDELVAWSDAAAAGSVPATWTPTTTNQAGQVYLGSGLGPVQALVPFQNSMMAWRSQGVFAFDYSGRPYIYTARLVSSLAGAANLNCVFNCKGTQVALAQGDFIQTDGTQVRSLGEGRIRDWVFSQMSQAGLSLAHGYVDTVASEAVWHVALGRDDRCNYAIVWNYERDKWSIREIPLPVGGWMGLLAQSALLTWDADSGTWDADPGFWDQGIQGGYRLKPLAACPDSGVQILQQGATRWTGEAVSGTIERTGLKVSSGDAIAKVQRIIPAVEGSNGTVLTVQVGGQLAANGSISWGPVQNFTLGTTVKVDCNARGRFVGVRIGCAGPDQPTVAGFAIEYDEGGRQ